MGDFISRKFKRNFKRKFIFINTRNDSALFWGLLKRMHKGSPEWNEKSSIWEISV